MLNIGLGFVPTPAYNPFRALVDLFKLIRLLKLRKHFGSFNDSIYSLLRRKSIFIPSIRDLAIITFEKLILRDLSKLESSRLRMKHNLTQEETMVLKSLWKDTSVVIKPTDKGGGVVIIE